MIMDAETIYRAMESLSTVPERLTLGHEESTVTLSHPDGWTLILPTTGKTLTASWFGGTEVDIQADWRHDALRIERTRDVVTAVDALTYDPSSSRLMIETTIAGGMAGELKLRRIYQRGAQDTSGAAEGDPVFQEPGRDGVGRP